MEGKYRERVQNQVGLRWRDILCHCMYQCNYRIKMLTICKINLFSVKPKNLIGFNLYVLILFTLSKIEKLLKNGLVVIDFCGGANNQFFQNFTHFDNSSVTSMSWNIFWHIHTHPDSKQRSNSSVETYPRKIELGTFMEHCQ